MDLISGTVLLHYIPLVKELGGDPEALLTGQGIDVAAAGCPDRLVNYTDVATLMGVTADALRRPDFAMRLAQRQGVQSLGPVAVLIRHAATVADALDGVCRYLYHCAPPDIAKLERRESTAVFTLEIALRQMAFRDHWIEKGLALTMDALRLMLGDDFAPIRVTMQHRAMSPREVYRDVFHCPVEFACEHNAIHFPLAMLSKPIPGRDPTILALAENYLSQVAGALPLVEHVQELIHRMLKIDQASLASVAKAMIVHPRVLQRRLAEQGTTFEAILDGVRKDMAWQLSGRINRVSQIAAMLGYAEQCVYTRACKRWYGMTPRQLIVSRQNRQAVLARS
ncbi:AraC family transcriptional regulator [Novosphingobium sediminis]|nr:AraC family transcriptional regulator [Novosphingobium sediminis]